MVSGCVDKKNRNKANSVEQGKGELLDRENGWSNTTNPGLKA